MQLFCFASRDERNIELGIKHQMWAVASLANSSSMQARVTKAERYLRPGAKGVLYCNPRHAFTTPFVVESLVDSSRVINDVWPQPWVLPFKIRTLGDLSRTLHKDIASVRWPVLSSKLSRSSAGGVSAAFNITGTTVFVPNDVSDDDWLKICEDLAK